MNRLDPRFPTPGPWKAAKIEFKKIERWPRRNPVLPSRRPTNE